MNIPKADLIGTSNHDILNIVTGNSAAEEIEVITYPDPLGLPFTINSLRGIQQNTVEQLGLLERARGIPGALSDIEVTQMTTSYCVQRADLVVYHRILTVWRDTQPALSVKRVIGHWLSVLDEIDAYTKTVLNILVSCR
ncbi:hypothetical protein BGZ97_005881 [Linnemannia gamsii]|uniref:Uncharacterized protein n=1 Tax=Linnemannia gamsii TaxID=64522 RepID=A0A9P6UG29_9FUNG|nr:hypothetical protein BGZ97_005881 [Linnemannia gamsii]